jgi:hypothetical protein
MEPAELQRQVGELVEAWCDRRALRALREVLAGYPLSSGLTEDWAELLKALEGVRAFARNDLTDHEAERVDHLIGAASAIVYRR